MLGEIRIDYPAVYSEIAKLRINLRSGRMDAESSLNQAQAILERMDGATNAELQRVLVLQRQKINITIETMERLLEIIEDSAMKMEAKEARLAAQFNAGMASGFGNIGSAAGAGAAIGVLSAANASAGQAVADEINLATGQSIVHGINPAFNNTVVGLGGNATTPGSPEIVGTTNESVNAINIGVRASSANISTINRSSNPLSANDGVAMGPIEWNPNMPIRPLGDINSAPTQNTADINRAIVDNINTGAVMAVAITATMGAPIGVAMGTAIGTAMDIVSGNATAAGGVTDRTPQRGIQVGQYWQIY